MRKIQFILIMMLILFVTACSNDDQVTPNDRFEQYAAHWNKQAFDKMYSMLSNEATTLYPTEEVVDRYKKIYEDLSITDVNVSFSKLSEEKLKAATKNGEATIPFTVEMNSAAGPITFDYDATLVEQGEKDNKNWFINWDPGFIFPQIKDGGKIRINTVQPTRGEIEDRNKMPLAINASVWEIGVVPEELVASSKQTIASLLNMSVETIDKQLNASWVKPNLFVPLKKVPPANEALLEKLWAINGVKGKEVTGRVYPAGEDAAHLVGYIGKITAEELEEISDRNYDANDLIGKRGLEQLYEEKLRGEKGVTISITKDGEEEQFLAEKPVKNGENIALTIDVNVQSEIFKSFGEEAGTAVAIHPKTGETLALVSSPSFDPNDFIYGIQQSKWDELQKNPQNPLLNRFASTYAPGSVMKPITAAIGLQEGTIKPNEGIEIKGLTWSNGKGWGDYKVRRVSTSSKPVDVTDALVRSDNIFFAKKAVEMGDKALVDGLKQFGIGEDVPFEYPITPSSISASGSLDDEVLLANTSYGQGEIQLSSLHLAAAFGAFLNNGTMVKPTLLLTEETGQPWKKDILSADHAQLIQKALRKVVTNGTAKEAQKADFPISGKTGTAELKLNTGEDGDENGWFVGYPTDEQNIVIAMMLEKVQDKGASHLTTEKVTNILKAIR
ncbi:penicillin-binding transpeptidase domain-containing protein [Virgibacillus sp. MG-45]|uniref:penicillin-binding transpeptidase domain-containing protein n=1 Tax=Virgibacillus sp. MG-45 TaxID=3102791 RepID=UPI002ED9C78C